MGKSILQLNFPPCTNEGVFLVDDISIYDPNLVAITTNAAAATSNLHTVVFRSPCDQLTLPCASLEITPPGFSTPTVFSLTYSGFKLVLNACLLGILPATSCNSNCPDLPDGMYNVRYSIAPNDQVYVEYKIMRIVRAWNRYEAMVCAIGLKPCMPDSDVQSQLRDLDTIRNYLISAKMTVENEHQFEEGMDQYRFAVALMDKMSYEPNRC